MKLEIRKLAGDHRGLRGAGYRYLIDGHDISNGLTGITLRMGADINTCDITLLPDEIEVDAEALVALEAVVLDREAAT
jgi:hypothetical protein